MGNLKYYEKIFENNFVYFAYINIFDFGTTILGKCFNKSRPKGGINESMYVEINGTK